MPRPRKYETGVEKAKSLRIRIPTADIAFKDKLFELAEERGLSLNEYVWNALKNYISLDMKEITVEELITILKRETDRLSEEGEKLISFTVSMPVNEFVWQFMTIFRSALSIARLRLIIEAEANIIERCKIDSKTNVYNKWAYELLKIQIITSSNSIDFEKLFKFLDDLQFYDDLTNTPKLSPIGERILSEKDVKFYDNAVFIEIAEQEYIDSNLMILIGYWRAFINLYFHFFWLIEQGVAIGIEDYKKAHPDALKLNEHQFGTLNFLVNTIENLREESNKFEKKRDELNITELLGNLYELYIKARPRFLS